VDFPGTPSEFCKFCLDFPKPSQSAYDGNSRVPGCLDAWNFQGTPLNFVNFIRIFQSASNEHMMKFQGSPVLNVYRISNIFYEFISNNGDQEKDFTVQQTEKVHPVPWPSRKLSYFERLQSYIFYVLFKKRAGVFY
jgi:hypothetical protein